MKVQAKEDTITAQEYGIAGFPTVVLLDSNGEEIDRILGYRGPEPFIKQIENYEAGIGTFLSVLKEFEADPMDVHLNFEVAEKYYGRGDLDDAVTHYERVFLLDQWNEKGKSDVAIYYIGVTHRKDKEYDRAALQFQRMMDTYPNSSLVPDALVYKAFVYQKGERKAEAIAAYESFIETYPDHDDVEWAQKQIAELKGNE
ncbi:MAG: tetratricopeptide repeat protein [Gemmatimonadota bacterium]|nr:MAG: tetratricopeptide repeat protein [Gemmatimonadota bacterium]